MHVKLGIFATNFCSYVCGVVEGIFIYITENFGNEP